MHELGTSSETGYGGEWPMSLAFLSTVLYMNVFNGEF